MTTHNTSSTAESVLVLRSRIERNEADAARLRRELSEITDAIVADREMLATICPTENPWGTFRLERLQSHQRCSRHRDRKAIGRTIQRQRSGFGTSREVRRWACEECWERAVDGDR